MQSDALPEVTRQAERKERSAKPLSIQVCILEAAEYFPDVWSPAKQRVPLCRKDALSR